MIKKILLALLVILIVIQFIKPKKNIHPGPQTADISTLYPVPANVDSILAVACKDCHSNNTRYPWYNNIQPVAWFLANHVTDGKRSFNLNEFATYPVARQYDKIEEIKKQIDKGDMPLSSYTLIHKDAVLTDAQKKTVIDWSENIRQQMEAKYPKDSLVKRRPPAPPAAH
ncbi:MAG: heme-binding domain-containing protein [Ginsengibacter sp.]